MFLKRSWKMLRPLVMIGGLVLSAWPLLFRSAPLALLLVPGLICLGLGLTLPRPPSLKAFRIALASGFLIVLLLMFSLTVLELAVRLFGGENVNVRRGLTQPHSSCVCEPVPGAQSQMAFLEDDGSVSVIPERISSQGFRDREYGPKAANEFRILMLGDSYTWGTGLQSADTIPKVLEERVAGLSLTRRVSVINGGCAGFSPWQARARLLERGLGLEPDLVILQVFMTNDVTDTLVRIGKTARAYNHRNFQNKMMNLNAGKDWKMRLELWLREYSRLYVRRSLLLDAGTSIGFFLNETRLFHNPDIPSPPHNAPRSWLIEINLRKWYPELDEGWRLMKEDIRQIRRDCQTRGIGFVAFATPIAQELFDNSWNGLIAKYGNGDLYERGKGTRIAEEFFQQEGIPFVSVAEPLRKYPEPSQLYYILNGHFREAGATVVAECLAEYLTTHVFPEKGLIRKNGRQAP